MPPWSYRVLHADARLSDAEREELRLWVRDAARFADEEPSAPGVP